MQGFFLVRPAGTSSDRYAASLHADAAVQQQLGQQPAGQPEAQLAPGQLRLAAAVIVSGQVQVITDPAGAAQAAVQRTGVPEAVARPVGVPFMHGAAPRRAAPQSARRPGAACRWPSR